MFELFVVGAVVFTVLGLVHLVRYLGVKKRCVVYPARIKRIISSAVHKGEKTYILRLAIDYRDGAGEETKEFSFEYKVTDKVKKPKFQIVEGGTHDVFWEEAARTYYDMSMKKRWWQCFIIAGCCAAAMVICLAVVLIIARAAGAA